MLDVWKKLFGRRAQPAGSQSSLNAALARRDRVEQRLEHAEQEFAKLVADVRDYAIFLLDTHGNVVTWNAGAERIKGYRAEEIIGRHFSQFYPEDAVSSGWPAHELTVAAATGRFEDEGWRLRKDGSRFWANVVITALGNDNGGVRGFLKITRDLTDRKQAEEKLRLSEERFRLMVESVPDYAIFMLDPEGRVATWNSGAARIKGYKAEEIIGQHFSRFYPEEALDRDWPAEELRRAVANGYIEDEGWRVRKDGTRFWANVVITALRDETGALRGFGKVTRDLTERREAEENARRLLQEEAARKAAEASAREAQRAREEEQRQRSQLYVTLTSIGDAVIVTDVNGAVTFMNPVAVSLTGWEPSAAAGQPLEHVFKIVNEETRQPVESPVAKVLRDGVVVGLANHTVLLAKDGREVPIDDSGAPIRGEDGGIAGVVLVFRDVTEARRAVEARLHLASIVESSDDAIIGKSLEGTILSWNKGAERLYGYTADEILGQPLSLLVPPDHADELPQIMEKLVRGERIDHLETQRVRKDGTRVDVSLTISPIRNSEGKIVGASKIARDITAKKEEDRRKNEFLALLAHELRNPLAALGNSLQVMRLAESDRQKVDHVRTLMERQLQHLVRLVDDLLDISRISRGKLQLRRERVPLAAVISSALETCEPLAAEHGQELIVSVTDEPLFVEVDRTRMAQAICNLISNAAKYSDRGSRIWLTVEHEDDQAVVRVRDTGIGIPPHMLNRVFDMFTQVDQSLEKSRSGLGVGLTIVKRLIEMHGGSVEARSEGHGKGSEFIIRLPTVAPRPDQPPDEKDREPQQQHAAGCRILVVEDNADAAETLTMILEIMGHQVRIARDGLEGVEAAAEYRPELILLDLGMPKLNGYEACRRIREQPWGRDMVLVALTGWGQDEDKLRSREAGFDHHLVKPVEPAALEELLAAFRSAKA